MPKNERARLKQRHVGRLDQARELRAALALEAAAGDPAARDEGHLGLGDFGKLARHGVVEREARRERAEDLRAGTGGSDTTRNRRRQLPRSPTADRRCPLPGSSLERAGG